MELFKKYEEDKEYVRYLERETFALDLEEMIQQIRGKGGVNMNYIPDLIEGVKSIPQFDAKLDEICNQIRSRENIDEESIKDFPSNPQIFIIFPKHGKFITIEKDIEYYIIGIYKRIKEDKILRTHAFTVLEKSLNAIFEQFLKIVDTIDIF